MSVKNWDREQASIALFEVIRLAKLDIKFRSRLNNAHRGDPHWHYVPILTTASANAILDSVTLLDKMWGIGAQCKKTENTVFNAVTIECEPSFVPSKGYTAKMKKRVLRSVRRVRVNFNERLIKKVG